MYVVNLFGGPGSGKSTQASALFTLLKMHGVNAELVTEFAKDLTWEERKVTLQNQTYVFGKQHHKQWKLRNKVDVAITDSPIILSLLYVGADFKHFNSFERYVLDQFDVFNNINYFLTRDTNNEYQSIGRNQKTVHEAMAIDCTNLKLLRDKNISYDEVPSNIVGINRMLNDILKIFSIKQKYSVNDMSSKGSCGVC